MKVFKYNYQYLKFEKGTEKTVKSDVISTDSKAALLAELAATGLREVRITRTKLIS